MRNLLRTLLMVCIAFLALGASAQPYTIYVVGHIAPCDSAMVGSTIWLNWYPTTGSPGSATTVVTAPCNFFTEIQVSDTTGILYTSGTCSNGSMSDSVFYSISPLPTDVLVNLSCVAAPPPPCSACITTTATAPFTATFSSCSTGGAEPFTYIWDFSDAGAEPGNPIAHVFPGPGTYAVCLNITDANGTTCNTCQQVMVESGGAVMPYTPGPCQACMTMEQGTDGNGNPIPFAVQMHNCSTGNLSLSYFWQLPDGTTSTLAEPQFTLNGPGTYDVCLAINDNAGCSSYTCDSLYLDANGNITGPPPACSACITTTATAPFTATFTSCSTGGTAPFTYIWDFSDAGAEPGDSIAHVFPGPGIYAVCLNITDANGITCNTCQYVLVESGGAVVPYTPGPCQACMTMEQGTDGNGNPTPFAVQMHDCSTGNDPLTYFWQLSDGTTSTLAEPQFTLNAPGTYEVCLSTSDITGCSSYTCDSLYLDANGMITTPEPIGCNADFWTIQAYDSTANGVEPIPNEVWVWNLSSGGNGIYEFTWDFGDGSTSTEAYPSHEYDGPGPWLLCLTMHSGNCDDTYCDPVSVDENGILNGMIVDGHPVGSENASTRSGGFTLNVIQAIPTGMTELPALADLNVWPNPAQDELNLVYSTTGSTGNASVMVIDQSGRTVHTEQHRFNTGSNNLRIGTADLEPGLYLVRIADDARSITQRFMKVR